MQRAWCKYYQQTVQGLPGCTVSLVGRSTLTVGHLLHHTITCVMPLTLSLDMGPLCSE